MSEPPPLPQTVERPSAPVPLLSWTGIRKVAWPALLGLIVGAKYFAKLKFLVLPLAKLLPVIVKTGGTMLVTIWAYAMAWGLWFAVGFVALIFVHECGHLIAARRLGLKVGAPVFIPFMGAFIALKEAPRDAWIEAQVGIGGPLLGAAGAAVCAALYQVSGYPLLQALAYTGFFLNLFNLAPLGMLDGGRIATALSPWLWIVGLVVVGVMMLAQPNIILLLILVFSVPRLVLLFRKKTDEERRYFEVSPARRLAMGALYFGLIISLVAGMAATRIEPPV